MQIYLLTLLLAVGATCQIIQGHGGFMRGLVSNLQNMPVFGNFFRASVDPLYQPLVNPLQYAGIQSREGEEIDECFGEIGCLDTPPEFFHYLQRPINLPAYTRDQINVTYKIHTRQVPHGTIVPALELQQRFDRSTFNPNKDTKIIIHGFLDTSEATWMVNMVRAFLHHAELNVISVDWSGGSRAMYTQATANTRVVGLEVAHLVNWLGSTYGIDLAKLHIVGHSLGAHTAGYAGELIPGLGRITGLDPAEPYFQYMDPIVRLDPSDANFVDVIHSDVDSIWTSILSLSENGFGLEQPVGHIDFYPNEGRSQPGCSSLARIPLTVLSDGIDLFEGMDAAQKEFISCNHVRAPKLFTDSILSECPYTAFQCDSFKNYAAGLCMDCGVNGTNCAPMGLHADKWQDRGRENVKMFLSTSDGPAFCTYHYQLDIAFSDPENIGDSLRGRLKISFIKEDGTLTDFDLTPDSATVFKKGGSVSYALTHPSDLSGSKQALISWVYEADVFAPLSYCVPLFCSSDLQITALALTNCDSKAERNWNPVARIGKVEEVVMCHTLGDRVINIPSEKTINVAASTSCPNILTKINQKINNGDTSTPTENDIVWEVKRVEDQGALLKRLKPWKPWTSFGNNLKKEVATTVGEWQSWGNDLKEEVETTVDDIKTWGNDLKEDVVTTVDDIQTWGNDLKDEVVTTVTDWIPFSIPFSISNNESNSMELARLSTSNNESNSMEPARPGRSNNELNSMGKAHLSYHYILTLAFTDPRSDESSYIRGTFKLSFIKPDGQLTIIDLTEQSGIYFPRKGNITFSIINKKHIPMEDLTQIDEVLVTWIFQPDILNPLSYCAMNCKTELLLEALTLTSYDAQKKVKKSLSKRGDATATVTMCGVGQEKFANITSYQSLILRASENCTNGEAEYIKLNENSFRFRGTAKRIPESNENVKDGHVQNDDAFNEEISGYFGFFVSKVLFGSFI